MPVIDESVQDRQTFGNAPGWSGNQKVIVEPAQDATGASSTPDAQAAPSAEVVTQTPSQEQVSQEATAPTSQPEPTDVPFNKHPRWIERQRELEEARRQRDEAQRLTQLALERQPIPQQPQVQPQDPWAGLVDHPDSATAQFWQTQRKLQEPLMQRVQGLEQTVTAGTQELAELRIENFRLKNPEITPNSPEENAVAGYVRAGYRLNDAKKLALYDLKYGKLEEEVKTLKSKQSAIPQKVAAARSEASAGIPNTSGLPPARGDWRERVSEIHDKGGTFKDMANAIFGGGK